MYNFRNSELFRDMEYALLILFSFFIPLFVHNQILTGIAVNCAIVLSSLRFKRIYSLPVMFLPSLGVFFSGIIFGNLTKYIIYLIPFIILGSFVLAESVQASKNKIIGNILGILLKVSVIFFPAFLFAKFGLIPESFIPAMGLLQIITAFIGSVFAQTIAKSMDKSQASRI